MIFETLETRKIHSNGALMARRMVTSTNATQHPKIIPRRTRRPNRGRAIINAPIKVRRVPAIGPTHNPSFSAYLCAAVASFGPKIATKATSMITAAVSTTIAPIMSLIQRMHVFIAVVREVA